MITFAQLRDAKPQSWKTAADDLVQVAREADQAASDIYARGSGALDDHWTDAVGQRAGQQLKDLANRYEVAAAAIRGVVSVLDGLSEAVEITQRSLHSAVDYATRLGLTVDDQGAAHVPENSPDYGTPMGLIAVLGANELIDEALKRATQIDGDAATELDKIVSTVRNTDLDKELNETQAEASQDELRLIRDSLPVGQTPGQVRDWWNSLSPQEQDDLEKAVPVDLYDLNGIPQDVKDSLKGDYGYDRIEFVRWAQQNWNNKDIDIFDNNCANFVSTGLEHAGLKSKGTFTFQDDTWGHGGQTGWDWLDKHDHSHTRSWTDSNAQRDFMLRNGGEQVPLSQARPGDIIYLEQAGTGGPTPAQPGTVHHAVIVTSVTPDGDIHYTQHTDSRLNVSLNGRLPHEDVHEGDQKIVVVRVNPNWYEH
jgi:hypothetical protein